VGCLRDEHAEVDLDGVRDQMKAVHDELSLANQELLQKLPEAGDLPTRLANTFARI
jgi:division protein CdvB (Snf7/Vps24/ESCRT-III family)